ncbi:MAG: glycosyltransferase [Rhodoferax sp.]|uniref:glycosyltransferase n=1 Tax=Rhodoferax sp. TaxID=50421 RepID=UPI002612927E|nr:glycosyltransferase [Rhodoferax sp.]MDD2881512.1 glycosyltransferase [Rhodoferax sp.]
MNNLQGTAPAPITVAVLLPCYNEGLSIRKVVEDFRRMLPEAKIYVYDNRSTDNTTQEARAAGAQDRTENWPGKGNVVRRMFLMIDIGVKLMVKGNFSGLVFYMTRWLRIVPALATGLH